jgi:hypothetical protein
MMQPQICRYIALILFRPKLKSSEVTAHRLRHRAIRLWVLGRNLYIGVLYNIDYQPKVHGSLSGYDEEILSLIPPLQPADRSVPF